MASDNYDDRGRDDRRDDRRDGYDDRGGGGGDPVAVAKKKVGAPGILMIVSGILGVVIGGYGLYQAFTNPYATYDLLVKIFEGQPDSPQKDKMMTEFAAKKEEMRLDSPMQLGSYGLSILLSLLTAVGGFAMKGLGSRGLAMTGAIASVIPIGWCCLLTIPLGIWALVVLSNPFVKRAFELKAGKGGAGRTQADDDPRWGDSGR